ncbi:MAG: prolyl oligopeptidase family serine peptidase [Deltaproteobacteria bacterium]|nr:prolyl oligopeptidase family serine peptidase [Deltaproteobacteria bacterium]
MKTPSLLLALALFLTACSGAPEKPEAPIEAPAEAAPAAEPEAPPAPAYPETRKAPVSDTYHGVTVTEDYRWLEDASQPEVMTWVEAQNAFTREKLDALPGVPVLRERIGALMRGKRTQYGGLAFAGGHLFSFKVEPPKQQAFIVVTDDWNDSSAERVVVDPNVLDPSGGTSIDWFFPSHDGKLLAVSLAKGGTEKGDLHVFETATGKQVHEVIPGVNGGTAGGSVAWAPDDRGFYYTRYPRGDERPEDEKAFWVQVYFHRLGTPTEKDRYELGKDFPKIAEIDLRVDRRSGRVLCTVQNGDGGEFSLHLREKKGKWRTFSTFGDGLVQAVFGLKDDLYLVSLKGSPRGRLLRMPIKSLDPAKAVELLPEGEDTLVPSFWGTPSIVLTKSRLYATYQLGGPSQIRVFDHRGKALPTPEQLPVASVGDLTPVNAAKGDDLFFSARSFLEPTTVFHLDGKSGKTAATALRAVNPASYEGVEVIRELATSKDGTKVPVNILAPKGIELDGSHPLILYGYGGYGVNMEPYSSTTNSVFLENGILYAVANIRGGGEFGEAWHRQGNLENKQNVFDDFEAVARHLVTRGYTSSERLGIRGGSNGGLLMGATITQHPELARVCVSHVGIYDMLRVELHPNGAFNVTEFGTVKDEGQFRALHAYSPYHRVVDGTAYPATLLLTGMNDPRVDALNSRKMAARLQAATAGDAPILLRTSLDTGHGMGTPLDEQIAQYVDEFAFFFAHLGVEPKTP